MELILIGLGIALLVIGPFLLDLRSIRMAMRIKKGDYPGAIAIAEAIPEKKRSIGVVLNHIAAHYHGGQKDEARALFLVANRRKDYPAGVQNDLKVWEQALFP